MHYSFYINKYFDLVTNPFKYKCEISQNFIHPFKNLW